MKEAAIRLEASRSIGFYRLLCRDPELRLSRLSVLTPRSARSPESRFRISVRVRAGSTLPDDPVFMRGGDGTAGAAGRSACLTARLVRFRLSGNAGIWNEWVLLPRFMVLGGSFLFAAGS